MRSDCLEVVGLRRVFAELADEFRPPHNVSVVIFNEGGAEFLAKAVLTGIKCVVLPQRKARFFSLGIARRFLRRFHLILQGGRGLAIHRRLFLVAGNVRRVYLLACLMEIAPKVVITYVDNDYDFQWLSDFSKDMVFIAVQNGVREDYDLSKWLPAAPHPACFISLPHYYCFGEYEIDLYANHGHAVKQFHPVGSLRASYYLHNFHSSLPQAGAAKICLISQWASNDQVRDCVWPEFYPAFKKLCEYLRRYVIDAKVTLVVALRSQSVEEKDYFSGIFGEQALLVSKSLDSMMSYRLVDSAAVTVTADSTLGREAFSYGKRVLFCNLSEHVNYSCPREGIWALTNPTYQEFSDRLGAILSMRREVFASLAKECANYLMRDPRLIKAHDEIRKHIESSLLNR